MAEAYGTWVEKSMYGKTYMGMERSTFVIDADGNVAKIMRKVKPADHADDVLAALSYHAVCAGRSARSDVPLELVPGLVAARNRHVPLKRAQAMIGR